MIVERNFTKFVVFGEDPLSIALDKINGNQARVIFAVSEGGLLEGVLTDGDLRRWLTSTPRIDLGIPVERVMNPHCLWVSADASAERIASLLSPKILALPLLDRARRLVAVALPGRCQWEIEGRLIAEDAPALTIAEIGNNHNGDLDQALRLIDAAAAAGADCAKLQMRDLQSLYRNGGDRNDASADLGAQYTLDLLARFQLADDDLFRAFDHCRRKGLIPLCTPWDEASFRKLEGYGLAAYKVASADFTNYDLTAAIASAGKPMLCSTGMACEREVREGVRHLKSLGVPLVLLHCNSTYPTPFKDVDLAYLKRLREISGELVGYSGHERDIHVAIAAVALGAKVVEKHFTLDKTLEGNDHKMSLLPDELERMVTGIRQVEEALGSGRDRVLSQGETMNREGLAKSLVVARDIPAGTPVTASMIAVKSPGLGLQPNRKADLIGRRLRVAKRVGDYFFPSDLDEGPSGPRTYRFARAWGVPVRYHDLQATIAASNPRLVEIHLSYKDLELDFRDWLAEPLDLGLVVHAPELFAGDHTLDLCAADPAYRARSIRELQRVIALTRDLTPFFRRTERPCVVTNVGGFTATRHLHPHECVPLYERLQESLAALDRTGVEILPQTMPPFPWHFGGQQFHNLFVDADSILSFCARNGLRVCLDVSHSRLACNHRKESFAAFLRKVLPLSAHLHLADATGVDGEGLQIGEGEIDWRELWTLCAAHAPRASFIPEIWQGHKNNGEGAWRALSHLEAIAAEIEPAACPEDTAA